MITNRYLSVITIVFGCFICAMAGVSSSEYLSDENIISMLNSQDIQDRISVISTLNGLLDKNEIKLSNKVLKECYEVIEEEMNGKLKIDRSSDDEGLYRTGIFRLIENINDRKVLPYLINNSGLTLKTRKAILEHGEYGCDEIIKMANKYEKLTDIQREGIIYFFADCIQPKQAGYVATGAKREKIKNIVLKIYADSSYPSYEKGEQYIEEVKRIAEHERRPIVHFLSILGDRDVIPILKEIAEEDIYYKEYPEQLYKYKKMTVEKRRKYHSEIQKIRKERNEKRKVDGNALSKEKKIREYPIRNEAKSVLEKLLK